MNTDQQRTIDRVQKLFALARNNPNAEEAMSARLKARQILIENGLDPDMFNEDMTSTLQVFDEATAEANSFDSRNQANNQDNFQQQSNYNYHNQQNTYQQQQSNYKQQTSYAQTAPNTSGSNGIDRFLCWLAGAAIVFGLISMIWPWSIKSLLATIGIIIILTNIQYIIGIGVILGLGYFVERMISG